MISIFLLKIFWILLIVNRIEADQCAQTGPCRCNYEDGFGYDLQALDTVNMYEAYEPKTANISYLFRPCTDTTIFPFTPPSPNECGDGTGYAVTA